MKFWALEVKETGSVTYTIDEGRRLILDQVCVEKIDEQDDHPITFTVTSTGEGDKEEETFLYPMTKSLALLGWSFLREVKISHTSTNGTLHILGRTDDKRRSYYELDDDDDYVFAKLDDDDDDYVLPNLEYDDYVGETSATPRDKGSKDAPE